MTTAGVSPDFLSASTLSAISNASSSLIEPIDLELVEEIIERAPRSATSFPLVYRAYGQVLEDHGLSASTDTAYYQFLLKLGVIRAPTWGEKWDLYKTTQTIASRHSPRKVRDTTVSSANTRSRVPFLASASSDLDEAYGEETYDGDGESLINFIRPSPRKVLQERSRSLVGYTPSVSLDYDALTIHPPIRTSTPVYAQQGRRSSPPLPPYSVSDASEMVDLSAYEPSTPCAQLAADSEIRSLDERVIQEMEARADEFYRTGLMGRCWDVWVQSYDWVKRTSDQIDHVRSSILLRQTLAKWREAHERVLVLPGTADQHRQTHLQSQSLKIWIERIKVRELGKTADAWLESRRQTQLASRWKRWRTTMIRRRTERWKREVARKERTFTKARSAQLLAGIIERWYEAMRDRTDGAVADQHFTQNTNRQAFAFWLQRTVLQRKLNNVLAEQQDALVRQTFDRWSRATQLGTAARKVNETQERFLLRRVWDNWRIVEWRCREAAMFEQTRLLSLALKKWRSRRHAVLSLQAKAARYHRSGILAKTLHVWVIKERGALYERVKDVRLETRIYGRWRDRQDGIVSLNIRGNELAQQFDRSTLHRTLSRWRARMGDHHHLLIQAILLHETNELKRVAVALQKWKDAVHRIEANRLTAEKARAFFAQRMALKMWRLRFREREQLAYLEQRRLGDTRLWLDAWKLRLEQKGHDKAAIAKFQAEQDERIMAKALVRWTARVVEIKSREHDVLKQRHFIAKHNALQRWKLALKRVQDAKALMQSFIQIRSEEHLRSTILHWRDEAMRLRNLRRVSERSLIERDDRLLADSFGLWLERTRERGLSTIEEEVATRHEDALMFAIWDKWKARSTRLPEIAFTKRRILLSAWIKWRRALDMREKEQSVVVPRDQQLLLDILAVWREATRRKTALNAARRRGRVRPSLGEPRKVSGAPAPAPALSASVVPPRALAGNRRVTLDFQGRDRRSTEDIESVSSEPAYSRLRSELYGRRRGGSEEPEERVTKGSSELVKQLRGTFGR